MFHNVKPEEIFLSTFTEKAAFQLKEGLRSLLGLVTNLMGKPYDISKMYVGTVHSLCQKLLTDLCFLEQRYTFIKPTKLYDEYLRSLQQSNAPQADFSLIQQYAPNFLEKSSHSGNIFKHIIIDEYQDTNTIQERIFFKLASGFKNICVVGDDDQALHRFRRATVENFVQFLKVEEAIAVFGVYLLIFGKPVRGDFKGADYNDFHQWLNKCEEIAQNLCKEDQSPQSIY